MSFVKFLGWLVIFGVIWAGWTFISPIFDEVEVDENTPLEEEVVLDEVETETGAVILQEGEEEVMAETGSEVVEAS